jgi:hypothetical protein
MLSILAALPLRHNKECRGDATTRHCSVGCLSRKLRRPFRWDSGLYNRWVWEHDEAFKKYLAGVRCMGIDMKTAATAAGRIAGAFSFILHPFAFIPCFNAPAILSRSKSGTQKRRGH